MLKWNVGYVVKFLEIYKRHECLWNPRNDNYKCRIAKELALNSIVEELNIEGLTPNDIKLKIKSIRTAYKRELTTIFKSNRDNGKRYVPKLFWFKLADSFLRPVSLKKRNNRLQEQNKVNKRRIIETDGDGSVILKEFKNESIFIDSNEIIVASDQIQNECKLNENCKDQSTTINSSYKIHHSNDTRDEDDSNGSNNEIHEMIKEDLHSQDEMIHIENVNKEIRNNPIISTAIETTPTTSSQSPSITDNHSGIHTTALVQTQNIHLDNNNMITTTIHNSDNEKQSSITRSTEQNDEYFIFGRSVAAQLCSITDSYSRSVAKFKIQQILFEAETGHYKKGTYFTFPTTAQINNS